MSHSASGKSGWPVHVPDVVTRYIVATYTFTKQNQRTRMSTREGRYESEGNAVVSAAESLRWSRSGSGIEAIANVADREDAAAFRAELVAQTANVNIDRP